MVAGQGDTSDYWNDPKGDTMSDQAKVELILGDCFVASLLAMTARGTPFYQTIKIEHSMRK